MRALLWMFFIFLGSAKAFAEETPQQRGKRVKNEIRLCLSDVREYIAKKIDAAVVIEDPFPHLIIEDILPEHLYEECLRHWPNNSRFQAGKRSSVYVTQGAVEGTSLNFCEKHFWRTFGEVIVNRYIKPRILAKLLPYFPLKLGMKDVDLEQVKTNATDYFFNSRQDGLVLDRGGYTIPAHVDKLNIFAQMLLYFPRSSETNHLGTVFYRGSSHSLKELSSFGGTFSKKALPIAKKVSYNPNILVVFLQCPFAWHGVERTQGSELRRLYVSPIMMTPEFIQETYGEVYKRSLVDDYFFEARFLNPRNIHVWGETYAN